MTAEPPDTPHRIITAAKLPPAVGFAHGVLAAPGRLLHVAGEIAMDATGTMVGDSFIEQFDVTLGNVVTVVTAAGGTATDIVSMTIYTVDVAAYRDAVRALGSVWRQHMGRHFPAMALLGVTELVEPGALVEIQAVAVIPHNPSTETTTTR